MNSCSITEQSIAEGVRIILEQKKYRAVVLAAFISILSAVSFLTWTFSGDGAYLKIGSWELTTFFTYLVKFIASLIVSSGTFFILRRVFTDIKNGYVTRICELWVAANGTMVLQVEGTIIRCKNMHYEKCFTISQIANVLQGVNHVVYIVCDQRNKMAAFFPIPVYEKSFIDVLKQELAKV